MKRFTLLLFASLSLGQLSAQDRYLRFEDAGLSLDTFWNGQDTNIYLEDEYIVECNYDTSFGGFWSSGVAISTMRDDTTEGFTNLYSSIAGGGNNSNAYGVVSAFDSAGISLDVFSGWGGVYSPRWMELYITNTTYAYFSMLNGDGIGKKFGGASGDDPDYFFVRFYFSDSAYGVYDSVDFYLADFRSSNNTEDYIIDDWVYLDLNDFPAFEYYGATMSMRLFSSDVGQFGMNTPSYFCIDDVLYDVPGSIEERPRPSIDVRVTQTGFVLEQKGNFECSVFDLQGKLLTSANGVGQATLNTTQLPRGIYIIQLIQGDQQLAQKVFRW